LPSLKGLSHLRLFGWIKPAILVGIESLNQGTVVPTRAVGT
jgi:hypothetical protein